LAFLIFFGIYPGKRKGRAKMKGGTMKNRLEGKGPGPAALQYFTLKELLK
jgi:hypothetical protein